jgi:hypothetical protein
METPVVQLVEHMQLLTRLHRGPRFESGQAFWVGVGSDPTDKIGKPTGRGRTGFFKQQQEMEDIYAPYGGYMGFIKAVGRCAITGQPLAESEHLHVLLLPDLVNWAFPVWGGLPLSTTARAMAFVCHTAVNANGVALGTVKEAMELQGLTIIYHPVNFKIANANASSNQQGV